jgi:hypothetical protein
MNNYDTGAKSKTQTMRGRNASAGAREFIPLRDLLRRNHDDRVQEYLTKMNEESQDDVMYNTWGKKAPGETNNKQKNIIADVRKFQNGFETVKH